jgi:hypothetical protein
MIRDAERFANLASGVQSLVIAIAVIVGGGWSFYTFSSQLQVQNARAQLTKLERDLEAEPRVELDLDISAIERPSVDGPPIDGPSKKRQYFVATLSAKNVGTANTVLRLNEYPVELFKVSLDRAGTESWTLIRRTGVRMDHDRTLSALALQVGAANKTSFIIAVDSPGLYLAQVSAERTAAEAATARAVAGVPDNTGQIYWASGRYFVAK